MLILKKAAREKAEMGVCLFGFAACLLTYGADLMKPEPQLITYQKEVDYGDTVWSICGNIATDEDDLRKLVDRAMEDNHIANAGELKPGTLLVINVERARKD